MSGESDDRESDDGESDDRESDDGESDDSESGDNETSEEHCNISDRLHPLIEALKRQVEIETTLIEETKKLEEDGYFVVMSSVTAIIKNYNNAQKTTCYINDLVEAIQDAIEDAMFKQDKDSSVYVFKLAILIKNEEQLELWAERDLKDFKFWAEQNLKKFIDLERLSYLTEEMKFILRLNDILKSTDAAVARWSQVLTDKPQHRAHSAHTIWGIAKYSVKCEQMILLKSNASPYSLKRTYELTNHLNRIVFNWKNISFEKELLFYVCSRVFPEDFTLIDAISTIYLFSNPSGNSTWEVEAESSFGLFGISLQDIIEFVHVYIRPFVIILSENPGNSYTSTELCDYLQERHSELSVYDMTKEFNFDVDGDTLNQTFGNLINHTLRQPDNTVTIIESSNAYLQLISSQFLVSEFQKMISSIPIKERFERLYASYNWDLQRELDSLNKRIAETGTDSKTGKQLILSKKKLENLHRKPKFDVELVSEKRGLVIFQNETIWIDQNASLGSCVNYISEFISKASCPICLDPLKDERCITFKCGHSIHKECGRIACRRNLEEVIFDSCPRCNAKINTTWFHEICHNEEMKDEIYIFPPLTFLRNHFEFQFTRHIDLFLFKTSVEFYNRHPVSCHLDLNHNQDKTMLTNMLTKLLSIYGYEYDRLKAGLLKLEGKKDTIRSISVDYDFVSLLLKKRL